MASGLKVTSCTVFSLNIDDFEPDFLRSVLESQVKKNEHFFKYGNVVLALGIYLTIDELRGIVNVVENVGLTVVGISGKVDRKQSIVCKLPILNSNNGAGLLIQDYENIQQSISTDVVYRDILSGEILESQGRDLVIVGDVNHGATVTSKGNVIVLGKMLGRAHAGSAGDGSKTIIANDMRAQELRIADVSALGYEVGIRDYRSRICLVDGKLKYDN